MGEELRHVQNRWAGEASTQIKEASNNKDYEAKSNAFKHNVILRYKKYAARGQKTMFIHTNR